MRLALLAALAIVCAGCGGVADRAGQAATLVLERPAGAVHSGIYLATSRGFDEAEGVRLRIRLAADGAGQLESGRADMAVIGIDELARARRRGADLVGVMAIVQRPLLAVASDASRPRDLAARRVRGERAVARSVIAGDGGDPARASGAGGRVVRWDLEPRAQAFHLDDYGAPAFPGLVLAATRQTIDENAPVLRDAIRALQRGYGQAQADPESAIGAVPGDRAALADQMDAVAPAFTAGAQGVGQLRPAALQAWARWTQRYEGLRPDVARAFDLSLAGPPPRQ